MPELIWGGRFSGLKFRCREPHGSADAGLDGSGFESIKWRASAALCGVGGSSWVPIKVGSCGISSRGLTTGGPSRDERSKRGISMLDSGLPMTDGWGLWKSEQSRVSRIRSNRAVVPGPGSKLYWYPQTRMTSALIDAHSQSSWEARIRNQGGGKQY